MPEYVLVIAQARGAVGTLRRTARGADEGQGKRGTCAQRFPLHPPGALECLWDVGVCHYCAALQGSYFLLYFLRMFYKVTL